MKPIESDCAVMILVTAFLCVPVQAVLYPNACVRCSADINSRLVTSSKPTYLDLSVNRIRYLDSSVFRKQRQLETLNLSCNMLQSPRSDLLSNCTNLLTLNLPVNNVLENSTPSCTELNNFNNWTFPKTTFRS